MLDIQIGTNKITLYGSAKEMPIRRYSAFQRLCLIDSGVGSGMDGITSRFSRLFQLLGSGLASDALQEAKNLFYAHYLTLERISPRSLAFAALTCQVNSKTFEDITDDGLQKTLDALDRAGLTQDQVDEYVAAVKKKF